VSPHLYWFSSERGFLLLLHGRRVALNSVLSKTSAASWHTSIIFRNPREGYSVQVRWSVMYVIFRISQETILPGPPQLFFFCSSSLALYVAFAVANTVSPPSNMLCSHRCHYNDCHHDHTYTEQVYGSR